MDKPIEEKPLYRFFNVILFLAYTLVVFVAICAGFLGYSKRKIISASIICKDGTTWNALQPKNILYDSYASCGLCTKRSFDGKSYQDCDYSNFNASSYETSETKEVWSWSTITYPLVVFAVGFGVVDFVRLIILYIITGQVRFDKSLLLIIIVAILNAPSGNRAPKE